MVYHQKDSLSQNFIKYPSLVTELLDTSDINSNDLVLEIGPGKGIITKELAKKAKNVIAVEKDAVLSSELFKDLKDVSNLKIVTQDILNFNLPSTPYKVFSNIPFSITSEILAKFLKSINLPEAMYFIMQREAAEKFIGYPAETQSSILVKPWYDIEILGNIDRTNFTLKPQVIISFIQFLKKETPFIKIEDKQDYRDFVIYGFNQWQPTILESFQKIFSYNQLKIFKKTLKIGDIKPSEATFDMWLGLYKFYKKFVSEEKKNLIRGFERLHNKKIQ